MSLKLTIIAGARPNFMKIAPIIHQIEKSIKDGNSTLSYRLVHTGQHYDEKMSDTFFKQLNIPHPHINLGGGGGTQAEQTAAIMVAFEKELINNPADLVMVVGDVTSTLACSIVAKKLNTKVAHVEAGIRSYDITMPEEINRMVTDSITDYYFTTTTWAGNNLKKEGVAEDKIWFVGNVMIDTLLANLPRLKQPAFWDTHQLQKDNYLVLTLHRPSNVDDGNQLSALMEAIIAGANGLKIIFPVHPRTKVKLQELGIQNSNLILVEPMGYLEFNYLVQHAKGVITDSGGITEETTVMGIPCITLRTSTERPETVEIGTNELIGNNPEAIGPYLQKLLSGNWKKGTIPEKWDGIAAERIVDVLQKLAAS